MSASPPAAGNGATPSAPAEGAPEPEAPEATTAAAGKKHRAKIEHKVRGRIRMRVRHGKSNPEILEIYRQAFLSVPGVQTINAKPETGSIVIHYDPNREPEFERVFQQRSAEQLDMGPPAPPEDEIDRLANKIGAEAEFLAAHSRLARATVDFCKAVDRELKLSTGNTIDLKILLAGGLAAYTFLEIGGTAATPMWVTLALFSLNHFAELQTDHKAELALARSKG